MCKGIYSIMPAAISKAASVEASATSALAKIEAPTSVSKKDDDVNDWGAFAKACAFNLIHTLVIGVIGANMIFFVSLPQGAPEDPGPNLSDFFPYKITQYLDFGDPRGPVRSMVPEANPKEGAGQSPQHFGLTTEPRPCSLAATDGIDAYMPPGKDPGLVDSPYFAEQGWTSYYKVKAVYDLAAGSLRRNIANVFTDGKTDLDKLKEEMEKWMADYQVKKDRGQIGIKFKMKDKLQKDGSLPDIEEFDPPKLEGELSTVIASIRSAVAESKYHAPVSREIQWNIVTASEMKEQFAELNKMLKNIGKAVATSGQSMSGSVGKAVDEGMKAAEMGMALKAREKQAKAALNAQAAEVTLITMLKGAVDDATSLYTGSDQMEQIGFMIADEVEVEAKQELENWRSCLRGWELNMEQVMPYTPLPGDNQCPADVREHNNKDLSKRTKNAPGSGISEWNKRRNANNKAGKAAKLERLTEVCQAAGIPITPENQNEFKVKLDKETKRPKCVKKKWGGLGSEEVKTDGGAEGASGASGGARQKGGRYNRSCGTGTENPARGGFNPMDSWPYNMWENPLSPQFLTPPPGINETYTQRLKQGRLFKDGESFGNRPTPSNTPGFKNWIARAFAGQFSTGRQLAYTFLKKFQRKTGQTPPLWKRDLFLIVLANIHIVLLMPIIIVFLTIAMPFVLTWNSLWIFSYKRHEGTYGYSNPSRVESAGGGCCIKYSKTVCLDSASWFWCGLGRIAAWIADKIRCIPNYKFFNASYPFIALCLIGSFITYAAGHLSAIVQVIQYVITFTLLPLLSNSGTIRDILKCNAKNLAYIFGAFVVTNSYQYLNTSTAAMMTVAYALLLLRTLWKGMMG